MKIIHASDLHLGKMIYGVSLIDNGDQPVWVDRFLEKIDEVRPDAVMFSGDVFDRSAPKDDAYQLLDYLISELEERNIPVLMIAGNHDSGTKLQYLSGILAKKNVFISGRLNKELMKVTLEDEFGKVNFYLLPYIFPNLVAEKLEDDSIKDSETAIAEVIKVQNVDFSERNVFIAHQNIIANGEPVKLGGSESMVGGSRGIDYKVFDGFDYVALGHIHSSYYVGREEVRYAGSPLCYHFDETRQQNKGPILVNMGAKGDKVLTETLVIEPLHRMVVIKGTVEEVKKRLEEEKHENEYLSVTITDSKMTPGFSDYVRGLCEKQNSIVMELLSDYRPYSNNTDKTASSYNDKSIEEYFGELYREKNNSIDPNETEDKIIAMASNIVRDTDAEVKQKDPEDVVVDKFLDDIIKMF
ncbi:MAG: exonuclease SbcCD subunit D C-terminal domain-containing protein [Lachnospiraceae bacterium]|nr:exonuclease SbcCD subunit D C-terminal domain-containing protein [Lachnospiraceae bacterium]